MHRLLWKFGRQRLFSSYGPVKWLEDATTFSETHTSFVDPFTSLPYADKDLQAMLDNAPKEVHMHQKRKLYVNPKLKIIQIPIEEQVVVMFPGQGSQKVGMGTDLLKYPAAVDIYRQSSELLQYDLMKLCLEGPKSKLDQTIYCQPAIFVSSLAAWEKAKEDDPTLTERVTDAAGFSIGEFAALVIAQSISFSDALQLVKLRAEAMHECSQQVSSGMITVRVSAASRLEEAIEAAKKYAWEKNMQPICEIANYLFCGVKVVGASNTCLEFLEASQERYAFHVVKRLAVSGAFHTSVMRGAVERIRDALRDLRVSPPQINVYSNYTGKGHIPKERIMKEAIVKQVTSPVKWEQILQLLHSKHEDYKFPTYMEVGPGHQLGSMLQRISKKAYKCYRHINV